MKITFLLILMDLKFFLMIYKNIKFKILNYFLFNFIIT